MRGGDVRRAGRLYESAMFWLACAGVLAVIGGSVGIDQLTGRISVGLGILCLLWAFCLFWRHRRAQDDPPQPESSEPRTSTFFDARIGNLSGTVRSTADAVSHGGEIRYLSGTVEHTPGVPLTGERQERQRPAPSSKDDAPPGPDGDEPNP